MCCEGIKHATRKDDKHTDSKIIITIFFAVVVVSALFFFR
jgi:uncharacterized protein YpmB